MGSGEESSTPGGDFQTQEGSPSLFVVVWLFGGLNYGVGLKGLMFCLTSSSGAFFQLGLTPHFWLHGSPPL